MDVVLFSLAVLLVVSAAVVVAAVRSRVFFRLALNLLFKRKRLTVLTILGLLVGSSMVTGSLAMGDSMKYGVVEGVYGNLGAVDEVISSAGLFGEHIFDAVAGDASIGAITDAVAPLLVLRGAVRNTDSGLVESKPYIIGYDSRFAPFGTFTTTDGETLTGAPGPGEAVVNERLAAQVEAKIGDTITVVTRNPQFSVESIYSLLARQIWVNVTITAIVKDAGLGRFSLESGGKVAENMFLSLYYLQAALGAQSKLNTIVVSNNGDDREGVRLTGEVTGRLQMVLDEAVGYQDARFHVDAINYVRIENENVFFDGHYQGIVQSVAGQVPGMENISALTSYFVNNMSFEGKNIAYSTVTGLDPVADFAFGPFYENSSGIQVVGEIGDDEIIITNYTSMRLGAGPGDKVTLNYTVYDSTFAPIYETASFTVRYVVDLAGKASDRNLMPPFPGIRGKASCGDWDPPWVSGDKMRSEMVPEDLNYWIQYGGTPKAYISLRKSQSIWSNDLGNLTTLKVKTGSTSTVAGEIGSRLNASIMAGDVGIEVLPAKESGIESAEGVQLLTETFLAFGVVVMVSGVILAVALVGVVMDGRRSEIGILRTLGSSRRQITQTFAFEAFLVSAISSAIGILAGLLIALVCVFLTNTFWSNIVEGTTVQLHFTPETLVVGYVAGFLISFLAFVLSAHWISGSMLARSLKEFQAEQPRRKISVLPPVVAILGIILAASYFAVPMDDAARSLAGLSGPILIAMSIPFFFRTPRACRLAMGLCALAAVVYTFGYDLAFVSSSESTPFLLFFASGFAIVFACVAGIWSGLRPLGLGLTRVIGLFGGRLGALKVSFLSPSRRARRTCLVVSLFAVVVFTYLGLSANVQGQQLQLSDMVAHQGAGYDVLGETSISLRFDLGNATDRAKNNITGFPTDTGVVQFLTFGQIGGSCSNLRRNLPPRLIGANESFVLESQLRFQSLMSGTESGWSLLDQTQADGSIPAIGDYNTVVWILGRNIGDHIQVTDEHGVERQLVVVGITENSIFSGSVFVSTHNLNNLHPTTAEYTLFLFKTANPPGLVNYLEPSLQSYGMDASLVDELVRNNVSVEWSYMGLFQALLLLGLSVGILGLAASSFRTVEERKAEIGTMRALGFSRSMVLGSLILENLYVALLGIVVGIIAGLLTAFAFFGRGSLLSYGAGIPWVSTIALVLVVCVFSLLATIMPARRAAGMPPVEALRRDQ